MLLEKAFTGPHSVVVGGGAVGVEVALFLAERGTLSGETLKFLLINRAEDLETLHEMSIRGTKDVTIIEMIDKIGKDFGKTTRWGMLQDVKRFGVKVMVATRALEITGDGIVIEKDGAREKIIADTVVIAAGARPENRLAGVLEDMDIPHTVIGDAGKIGMAFDAIHQGFNAGLDA